jgi:hypothetical protein
MFTTGSPGTDYIFSGGAGLYYVSKPSGSSTWSAVTTLDSNIVLNGPNSLAASGGTIVAGGFGYANIYQGSPPQYVTTLRVPTGPQYSPPFLQTSAFGQSVALNATNNSQVVCDASYCYVYGLPGNQSEFIYAIAPVSPTPSVVDGPLFGFERNAGTCNFVPCNGIGVNDFTSEYVQAAIPSPTGQQTAGVAPLGGYPANQGGFLVAPWTAALMGLFLAAGAVAVRLRAGADVAPGTGSNR